MQMWALWVVFEAISCMSEQLRPALAQKLLILAILALCCCLAAKEAIWVVSEPISCMSQT
jgi:hypothetical protein